ncbi:hypothetical protein N9L02_00500 [Gammaproteobacteria bacterium]|nr:hypothetical protein [Gammaproteobacteria bacterium]
MKNRVSINFGAIVCVIALVYLSFKVLVHGAFLPFSIFSVQSAINNWIKHWHIIAIGLLPVYISVVFFGAAFFGIIFGSALQKCVYNFVYSRFISANK